MKKRGLTIIAACTLAITTFFQPGLTNTADAAAGWTGTHYGMAFDKHDSSEFDISNWANGDMFDCTWTPNNVKFNGGQMALTIDKDSTGYTGGEYRTKKYFGYGLYQVNMKPIKNSGVVSSFFTYTGPGDGTKWDEIDIEFLGYDTTKVQFNYYTNGVANHEYLYSLGFDASQSFHTYGFNWSQNAITWYVDGKAVYTATKDIPNTPGKIMMNVWPGRGVDEWLKPYNGRTGLTAYYDWASYDAPSNSAGNTNTNTNNNNTNTNTNNNTNAQNSGSLFDSSKSYKLINFNSCLSLDVAYGQKTNGANILQYNYNGYANQQWTIEKLSNGYYIIKSKASGKVLSIENNATWDGANVCQWEYTGKASQEWNFVPAKNNTYKIINRGSGKCLNVSWSSKDANANIEQYKDVNGDAQLWWVDVAK